MHDSNQYEEVYHHVLSCYSSNTYTEDSGQIYLFDASVWMMEMLEALSF